MTDLENRIRESLRDPRRQLPDWPDPMPRIRRAARRQAATLAGAAAVLLAGVALPAALLSGLDIQSSGGKPPHTTTSSAATPSVHAAIPRYPRWAGQLGGEVAYGCGDVLCLIRPDGTGQRGVPGSGRSLLPQWNVAWSADGSRLSFRGYYGPGDGQYDLYAADANGCHLIRLTHGLNGESSSWSASGRQITFSVPFALDVINANGTGLHQLLANRTNDSYGVDAPAWSVRNRIAFVQYVPARHASEIYAVNPDGSGRVPLTHGGNGFGEPAWSADGHSIAFTAGPVTASVVEVENADGSGARRVSPRSWVSYSPTWTPGGQLVFLRQTHPSTDYSNVATSAYIVNRDGTGLRLLYPNLNASQIAWGSMALPPAACGSP